MNIKLRKSNLNDHLGKIDITGTKITFIPDKYNRI